MSWRAARQALDGATTMGPVAQQNDPVLADITSCSRFLNATLVSGALATIGVVIRIAACWYSSIHIGTSTRCNRVLGNDSCPQSPVRGSSPERANLQLGTRSSFRTPLLGTSLTLCRMARIAKMMEPAATDPVPNLDDLGRQTNLSRLHRQNSRSRWCHPHPCTSRSVDRGTAGESFAPLS